MIHQIRRNRHALVSPSLLVEHRKAAASLTKLVFQTVDGIDNDPSKAPDFTKGIKSNVLGTVIRILNIMAIPVEKCAQKSPSEAGDVQGFCNRSLDCSMPVVFVLCAMLTAASRTCYQANQCNRMPPVSSKVQPEAGEVSEDGPVQV